MNGITDYDVEYYVEDGICRARLSGKWEAEESGKHSICGCFQSRESPYQCVQWSNDFYANAGESGHFDLIGIINDDPSGHTYDFWSSTGSIVDISLVKYPYEASDVVGIQQRWTVEDCEILCIPDTKKCVGNEVYVCSSDGAEWLYEKTCDEGYYCKDGKCIKEGLVPEIDLTTIALGAVTIAGAIIIARELM